VFVSSKGVHHLDVSSGAATPLMTTAFLISF